MTKRIVRRLAPAIAYLALAILWAAPSSLSPRDTVPDLGDPLHLGWIMAWDAHQIVRRPWGLFDSNTFYPYPKSLAFADHLLPEALLVAPVFWLTQNAVLSFNVAVLLALTASALAMFLLVRSLTGSGAAGFLAGLVYAFNAFTLHEIPRVHVLNVQWWPLALLYLDRFARDGRPRDARLFAAALVLQALSGTYYLAYSALIAPVWLLTAYVARGRAPRGAELRALAAALVVAALPVALVLWPYAEKFRGMGFEKSWTGGSDLLAYVDPGPRNALLGGLRLVAPPSELPHFVGYAAGILGLLGALVVLFKKRAPETRPLGVSALLTLVVAVLLSLGPLVHVGGRLVSGGPYDLLYWNVPLARGMASPERIGILARLGGAILVGVALAEIFRRLRASCPREARAVRPAAVAALALLLPLEQWSPPRPSAGAPVPTGSDVPAVYHWLAQESREPLVELPLYPDRAKKQWAVYLYFSTHHWRPIPLGRTSFYPPSHDFLGWSLQGFPDETSLALLDRLGIRTVVVHPFVWPAEDRDARLAAIDAHPRVRLDRRFDDVVPARFHALGLGGERVYHVMPARETPPRGCVPSDELPRESWTLRGTGVNKPDRVRDGNRRTAWLTERPQTPGDRIEVLLPRSETVAAVGLDLAYPYDEFPRNLVLSLQGEDGEWRRVGYADGPWERRETLEELLLRPREARMILRFPAQSARGVRLALGFREADPAWPPWSVPELRLYRECRNP